ncbi:MAG: hypothetical protein NT083_00330 [Rhodocyclales bacterium]|nr:hypothetical protein [Rhodocyclales bacterium]
MNWSEQERLRRAVPAQIDRHLANWARWARGYRVETGHRSRSVGFSGTGVSSAEDMEHECDTWAAEIADAVIDTLPIVSRNAIAAVYAGGRGWTLRLDLLDAALIEAGDLFWQRARRRGLL